LSSDTIRRLAELVPDDLESLLSRPAAVILPVGTIEWHSHHLPLGLDGLVAEAAAERTASLSGAVLAPTVWWAVGGLRFPYTFRLQTDPVEKVLGDALLEYARMGFESITVLNGHYGVEHSAASRRAATRVMASAPVTALVVADYEMLTGLGARADHAGRWETSLLWAARPELLREDVLHSKRELAGTQGADPRLGSRDEGEGGLQLLAERLTTMIERSLSESAVDREHYLVAFEMGTRVLEALSELRKRLPKSEVPAMATPNWVAHVEAMIAGEYGDARLHAERKLTDLTS
jgi:creatinine amidohydrolase